MTRKECRVGAVPATQLRRWLQVPEQRRGKGTKRPSPTARSLADSGARVVAAKRTLMGFGCRDEASTLITATLEAQLHSATVPISASCFRVWKMKDGKCSCPLLRCAHRCRCS